MISTRSPALVSCLAAVAPAKPPPRTATSYCPSGRSTTRYMTLPSLVRGSLGLELRERVRHGVEVVRVVLGVLVHRGGRVFLRHHVRLNGLVVIRGGQALHGS